MATHIPNPATYRPHLGKPVNHALIKLVSHRNSTAIITLSVSDYLEKMILHWYRKEFPNDPIPFHTKDYIEDLDFVQSV